MGDDGSAGVGFSEALRTESVWSASVGDKKAKTNGLAIVQGALAGPRPFVGSFRSHMATASCVHGSVCCGLVCFLSWGF